MREQHSSRLRGTFKLRSREATIPVVAFSASQSLPKTDPGPMKTQKTQSQKATKVDSDKDNCYGQQSHLVRREDFEEMHTNSFLPSLLLIYLRAA